MSPNFRDFPQISLIFTENVGFVLEISGKTNKNIRHDTHCTNNGFHRFYVVYVSYTHTHV